MNRLRSPWVLLFAVLALGGLTSVIFAQGSGYVLTWHSFTSGGASSGGGYTLQASMGEAVAGVSSGGGITMVAGAPVAATPTPTITPSPTPTPQPTITPTFTPSPTPTPLPTITPTITPSLTPTPLPTITPTFTPSLTPTPLPTITPTFTPSLTPTPLPTITPTITPTPTVTSVVTPPSAPDAFENDDRCDLAKPITVDGIMQHRTIAPPGDEDWVIFPVTAGATYVIDAAVAPASAVNLVMERFRSCEEAPQAVTDPTLGFGVYERFTASTTGNMILRLQQHGPLGPGQDRDYQLSVRQLPDTAQLGAVIIVAGHLSSGDFLQENIHYVTDSVYRLFLMKGYPKERIYYLAIDLELDPDADGEADVNALATVENLEYAITEWAPTLLEPGRALTLYMMDHGGDDRFYVNGATEILRTDELNGWLTEVEQAVDDVLINVVIEACRAGSFIQRGQSISGPGRVIVTSTNALAPAYASARGAYFSDAFFSALASDLSVASAFFTARWWAYAANPGQEAWLDDNGDSRYTLDDGRIASQRGFGDAGTFQGPGWQPPLIEWAEVTWDSSGEGVLRAQVRADSNMEAVAALIYPPDFVPPEDGQELVQPVPPVHLLDGNNDGVFVAQYDGFTQQGAYRIVFTAVDEDDQPALPVVITRGTWSIYLPAVTR